jgi:hypothetical protein
MSKVDEWVIGPDNTPFFTTTVSLPSMRSSSVASCRKRLTVAVEAVIGSFGIRPFRSRCAQ